MGYPAGEGPVYATATLTAHSVLLIAFGRGCRLPDGTPSLPAARDRGPGAVSPRDWQCFDQHDSASTTRNPKHFSSSKGSFVFNTW